MGLYAQYVLPRLINLAMQGKTAEADRARLIPMASGKVLEIGIGSGLNLPFYNREVEQLDGLDPSLELWQLARSRAARAPFPVEFIRSSAERIPAGDETFDTVVTTWTLCSIPDPAQALREMKRVLRPGGRFLFIEHGRSPDPGVFAWQNRLNPLWRRLAGGCNLNRGIDALIRDAGFAITWIETGYSDGPPLFTYRFRGVAGTSA